MTTYGDFPGVRVTTTGGGITAIDVGAEEKLVIFGNGDVSSGSASVNEPTQINSNRDADAKFGTDTELAQAMRDARGNGANIDLLYGVMYEEVEVTGESFGGSQTDTLANSPIVEDVSTITVTDTVASEDMSVEFRYEDSLATPSAGNTVFINPNTGDFAADSSSDYEFDYAHPDWQSALDAADNVLQEAETGIYVTLSEAESVASSLSSKVTALRSEFKLINGIAGAQPNTNSDNNGPAYDANAYTDNVDSDTQFLAAPVRVEDSSDTVLPGIAGLFAGNAIDNPIYNDALTGYTGLEQSITKSDEDGLADEQVIPVREAGSIRLKRSLSTSTEEDWERDFFRRRIVDRTILIAQQVGERTVGRVNNEDTREVAEDVIRSELQDLANDGVIQGNTSDEQNFTVEVSENSTDPDQIDIDIGITPFGVVKRIDAGVTIDTN
jgi:hypothetical protein